ncbi:heme-binding protein [Streptomyces canus]|uniref:heme-binding protein n=1 Tax=Streptomyces canus TaxID=58343 RepID=UPI0030E2D1C0
MEPHAGVLLPLVEERRLRPASSAVVQLVFRAAGFGRVRHGVGGVPIVTADGEVIGAIGVGGADDTTDDRIAQRARDSVAKVVV